MSGEQQQPWIEGDLLVSKTVMDDIEAHALECYPSECCGFATVIRSLWAMELAAGGAVGGGAGSTRSERSSWSSRRNLGSGLRSR